MSYLVRRNKTDQLTHQGIVELRFVGPWINSTGLNEIPFVQDVNPNLDEYATDKAMAGLFTLIAQEEKAIRQDPAARTTELQKRVFRAQN